MDSSLGDTVQFLPDDRDMIYKIIGSLDPSKANELEWEDIMVTLDTIRLSGANIAILLGETDSVMIQDGEYFNRVVIQDDIKQSFFIAIHHFVTNKLKINVSQATNPMPKG
jgi:hypothetical protein